MIVNLMNFVQCLHAGRVMFRPRSGTGAGELIQELGETESHQ